MLHHPFLEPNDLQMTNEDGDCSYALAYRVCQNEHHHPKDPLERWKECKKDREEDQQSKSEFDSERDNDELNLQAEWTKLATRNRRADKLRNGITTNLGIRLLDLAHDWHSSDLYYKRFSGQEDWFEQAKLHEPEDVRNHIDLDTLNEGQRTAFEVVTRHYWNSFRVGKPSQLLIHIDGKAGSGKSYLIDAISTHLREIAERHEPSDPVVRAAPTGIAAFSIRGQTLHRLLRLSVRGPFDPLTNAVLLNLQAHFSTIRYMIIDEKSMIGLLQLYYIDARLR